MCPILVPGQVVVLDNLTSHHHAAVRPLIEAQGCEVLFLSPYSPDFNPIELLFSKLNAWVRAQACRTLPALTDAIGTALSMVTPSDIAHWFHHAYPQLFL